MFGVWFCKIYFLGNVIDQRDRLVLHEINAREVRSLLEFAAKVSTMFGTRFGWGLDGPGIVRCSLLSVGLGFVMMIIAITCIVAPNKLS